MRIDDLQTPSALVDLDRLEANAKRMAEKALRLGVRLRPHVKTHKCVEAARIQTDLHFGGVTVSTLAEAQAFAAGGFNDITYAVPIAPQKIADAADLHAEIGNLNLLVDHPDTVRAIEEYAASQNTRLPVFLEIDCGGGRSGVDPAGDIAQLLVRRLADSESIDFRGLLTHAGHAYNARSRSEAYEIACEERNLMTAIAAEVRDLGVEIPEISVGSTPTLRAIDDLTGVTEARPGNYLFYDFYQTAIGSCDRDDVAFSVLATVISVDTEQARAIVDAGALALSMDPGPTHVDPECGFGLPVTLEDQHPLPGLRVVGMKQEHGTLTGPGVEALHPGTRLRILPNHSCLSAACFDSYNVVRGTEVVDEWHPARGW
ncbi:MAG: alanine racemase [Thermoanaerobaculales bacterium]|nr:alanine racemase [Thermoanaerobaculales bacterium]